MCSESTETSQVYFRKSTQNVSTVSTSNWRQIQLFQGYDFVFVSSITIHLWLPFEYQHKYRTGWHPSISSLMDSPSILSYKGPRTILPIIHCQFNPELKRDFRCLRVVEKFVIRYHLQIWQVKISKPVHLENAIRSWLVGLLGVSYHLFSDLPRLLSSSRPLVDSFSFFVSLAILVISVAALFPLRDLWPIWNWRYICLALSDDVLLRFPRAYHVWFL